MDTKILQDDEIPLAAELLQKGEIVGIPTETVYGLGCDARNPEAVMKVFSAKGRPADNPLIVHIQDFSQWGELVEEIPPLAERLAKRFWPGPLTIILRRSKLIPSVTAGGLDSVGVRLPAHPVAQAVIQAADMPIAAPSGNRSGRPSPTTAADMLSDMAGRIPAIIDGGPCLCGIESTVIALDDENTVRILRPGFITPEKLAEIAPKVIIDNGVLGKVSEHTAVRSPGMKYRHYAPNARVTLVTGSLDGFLSIIASSNEANVRALVFDDDAQACVAKEVPFSTYGSTDRECASQLFTKLRELDREGVSHIFVRAPRADGVGLAVYNRLIRAAGYEILDADAGKIFQKRD